MAKFSFMFGLVQLASSFFSAFNQNLLKSRIDEYSVARVVQFYRVVWDWVVYSYSSEIQRRWAVHNGEPRATAKKRPGLCLCAGWGASEPAPHHRGNPPAFVGEIEPRPSWATPSPPSRPGPDALPYGGHCGDHRSLCSASMLPSIGQFVLSTIDLLGTTDPHESCIHTPTALSPQTTVARGARGSKASSRGS